MTKTTENVCLQEEEKLESISSKKSPGYWNMGPRANGKSMSWEAIDEHVHLESEHVQLCTLQSKSSGNGDLWALTRLVEDVRLRKAIVDIKPLL